MQFFTIPSSHTKKKRATGEIVPRSKSAHWSRVSETDARVMVASRYGGHFAEFVMEKLRSGHVIEVDAMYIKAIEEE